jgi:hypothetical protein
MKKMNCWEFKRCGREMGGHNQALKICPAAMTKELHKAHGGTHAGRACWVVAGTMCGGEPQGTFAQKYRNCEKCDFYHKVKEEEGMGFELAVVLINRMTNLGAG